MSINVRMYRDRIAFSESIYGGHHEAVRKTFGVVVSLADLEELLDIYEAVQEYANSVHTLDANCFAGDCDDCSARDALKKLEALIGGPKLSRPK